MSEVESKKHVAPEGSTIPPYRIQYNATTNRVDLNITLHHVKQEHIVLDVKKKYLHFDTMKSGKKYWMEVSYPYRVIVNPEGVIVKYDNSCFSVRIPIAAVPDNFSELIKAENEKKQALKELKRRNEKAKLTGEGKQTNVSLSAREKLAKVGVPAVVKPIIAAAHEVVKRELNPNFGPGKPSKAKNPNRVTISNDELVKLAKRAGDKEIRNQQEKQIRRETKEELLLQQLEAREKRREEKKSKKKAIIESAKAKMAADKKKAGRSGVSADKK